ncbi:putative Ig domain-containing protein [Chloroflexota bacterium]
MKRNLIVIISSVVLILALIVTPVLAKENQNNGTPFQELWDAIKKLQQQTGPTQEEFDSLTSRVSELEAVVFNQPPIFESAPVLSADEDALYTYNIVTSDPDPGNSIIVTADLLPPWLSLTDSGDGTATLTGTPTNGDVGSHSVILQAMDNLSDSTTQSFTITVLNTNDAPVFTSDPETFITEDETYTYNIIANDVDIEDELTIAAPTLPGWLSFTDKGNGTAIISGVPGDGEGGEHGVKLEVTDGVEIVTQGFTITVFNVNDPPTIMLQDSYYEIPVGTSYPIYVSAYDIDSNDLELIVDSISGLPNWITITNNGDFSWTLYATPGFDDFGVYELDICVDDSNDISDWVRITIVVQ